MVEKKNLISLLIALFLISCVHQEKANIEILEISNKELKTELSSFIQHLDSTVEYKYVMWVNFNEINDSVFVYYVYPNPTLGFLDVDPFHFCCAVDNRPVFFAVKSFSKSNYENPFFKLKQEVVMDLIKHEFPEEYTNLVKLKKDELYLPFIPNEYPETLILIFTNGKLTEKKIGRGLLDRSYDVETGKYL